MRQSRRAPARRWQQVLLAISSPVVFIAFSEAAIRTIGLETDLARNANFRIAVPVWLLADAGWVDTWTSRIEPGETVPAEDVAWLSHFEEARYIQYKLKPNLDVAAVNPFNEIEVAAGVTFRITSNRDGFRDREFRPSPPGATRIVALGDSATFGWGVDAGFTYQRLLEDRLDASPTEVLNLGMPGFTSEHGLALLETLRPRARSRRADHRLRRQRCPIWSRGHARSARARQHLAGRRA